MAIEVTKRRTITRTATMNLSVQDIEGAIYEHILRCHKELKDYRFEVAWQNDGGVVVTGSTTSGDGGEDGA